MQADFNKIYKDLKSGNYAMVYFLQGEEPYYIDAISSYIEKNALEESQKGFNQMVLYGRDIGIGDVINNARRYPMMSERQVVLIKEAQDLKELTKEEGGKLMISYLNNPMPSTILVFCYKGKALDKRIKLYKELNKHSVLLTTKKLYENQVPGWVTDYVKGLGHHISPKASVMITNNIGNNLERLVNEIGKIVINFQEPSNIDENLVEKYVGISKDYNIFELQDALGKKNSMKSFKIVQYFGQNSKAHPLQMTLGALYSYFSKLLVLKHSRTTGDRQIASLLGVNPYFAKDYALAAKNYSLSKITNCIHYLKVADLQSKGVAAQNLQEEDILKELVFKIIS